MTEEINKIITATNTITTFRTFKALMIDMLCGYPIWEYFGKFESVFPQQAKKVVEILIRHEVIEKLPIDEVKETIKTMTPEELKKLPQGENRFTWYRLAPRGVDLAVSMVNLDYSEKVLKLSHETNYLSELMLWFTKLLFVVGGIAIVVALGQILVQFW